MVEVSSHGLDSSGTDGVILAAYDNYRLKGNEAFKSQRYQEAINLYTQALSYIPTSSSSSTSSSSTSSSASEVLLYLNRSAAYICTNKLDLALKDLKQGLAINPTHLQLLNRMGRVLIGLKEYKEAKIYYLKIMEENPYDSEAIKSLLWLSIKDRGILDLPSNSGSCLWFKEDSDTDEEEKSSSPTTTGSSGSTRSGSKSPLPPHSPDSPFTPEEKELDNLSPPGSPIIRTDSLGSSGGGWGSRPGKPERSSSYIPAAALLKPPDEMDPQQQGSASNHPFLTHPPIWYCPSPTSKDNVSLLSLTGPSKVEPHSISVVENDSDDDYATKLKTKYRNFKTILRKLQAVTGDTAESEKIRLQTIEKLKESMQEVKDMLLLYEKYTN